MKDLMTLVKPKMNIVNKTLDFVKKQLSGIDFAVTGSYANTLLNKSNTFNKDSDLDIAVEEKYVKMVANILLTMPDYDAIKKVSTYGPPPPKIIEKISKYAPPRYDAIKKVNKYDPPRKSIEKEKFSEYKLTGNLTPVHIIGSYTNKQKNEAVDLNGIKYLEPILPEYLSLVA